MLRACYAHLGVALHAGHAEGVDTRLEVPGVADAQVGVQSQVGDCQQQVGGQVGQVRAVPGPGEVRLDDKEAGDDSSMQEQPTGAHHQRLGRGLLQTDLKF